MAIACTAPLLGAFGTTVAMIDALRTYYLVQRCGICDVGGGPAEAFVLLALSLPVTVLARFGSSYLKQCGEALDLEMRITILMLTGELSSHL